MSSDKKPNASAAVAVNPFTAADVAQILHDRGWLVDAPSSEETIWCDRAALLLGPHAADHAALAGFLALIFHYDAATILSRTESHIILTRHSARAVLRHLAMFLLDDGPLTTDRFKEIIASFKEEHDLRGRDLFHPTRLALAGRCGEGDLDRVILLLDDAAALPFAVPVKSARQRILEFCSALD